jgi:glutamate N-acetyltransferase/amino-acid N-acetyltransferase
VPGWEDAVASADAIAALLKISPKDVMIESTGVIGKRIKMKEMVAALPALVEALGATDEDGLNAATAITTTDLASKSTALKVMIGACQCVIGPLMNV